MRPAHPVLGRATHWRRPIAAIASPCVGHEAGWTAAFNTAEKIVALAS
jgi:hypothetical protein